MGYVLGIDLGTTFTAAAVMRDGRAEILPLGNHAATIPTMVFLRPDDTVLIGDAAERRGLNEPARLAREFKRRLGDTAPIMLDRTPFSADRLLGLMLRQILADVSERQGGAPDLVAITHPANWGEYKIDLLRQAVETAGIRQAVYITEPVAAALQYAAGERVEAGETVAVYDLGGGTFDAAVLRKVPTGFELLGRPQGIERLGGIDFDEAVLTHVRKVVGDAISSLDPADPSARSAFARLRQECVLAKETLSADSDATVPVLLPNLQTQVRITRAEFEDMIRPILRETVDSLQRSIESAGVAVGDLKAVLLAGGSSRIPLVADMVRSGLGRPVVSDTHPKHAVALGAARFADFAYSSGGAAPTVLSGSILGSRTPLAVPPPAPAAPAPVATTPPPPARPLAPAAAVQAPPVAPPASPRTPAAQVTAPLPVAPAASAATRVDLPPVGPAHPAAPGSGGPAGPAKRPPWLWAAVAAAVAALVVVAVVVLSGGDGGGTAATSSQPDVTQATTPDTDGSDSTAPVDTGVTSTTTDVQGAQAQLDTFLESDSGIADALVGTYVVQLSAKYDGLEYQGQLFGPKEILFEHAALRNTYDVILVDAGLYDFQHDSQPMEGWYLTILATPFATKDEADQWCTDNGITDCFGRLFQPPVAGLQNTACDTEGYCVGISAAHWVGDTLYATYITEGFDPANTGTSGDFHVHFFWNTQDPATVGHPNSGLWYVWDRANGGGELVFTAFNQSNLADYGWTDGAELCVARAVHDHSLAAPATYFCLPVVSGGE